MTVYNIRIGVKVICHRIKGKGGMVHIKSSGLSGD